MKTIQFRCPKCLRLLVKWEVGSDKCAYEAPGLESKEVEVEGKKHYLVKCTKCGNILEVKKGGLALV